MEWALLASIMAVVSPAIILISSYSKTWTQLDITIQNLSVAVEKLSNVVEEIRHEQSIILQRLSKEEIRLETLNRRVGKVEDCVTDVRGGN